MKKVFYSVHCIHKCSKVHCDSHLLYCLIVYETITQTQIKHIYRHNEFWLQWNNSTLVFFWFYVWAIKTDLFSLYISYISETIFMSNSPVVAGNTFTLPEHLVLSILFEFGFVVFLVWNILVILCLLCVRFLSLPLSQKF